MWCSNPGDIGAKAKEYFEELFNLNGVQDPSNLFVGLRKKVTTNINGSLTRPVLDSEIKKVVFSTNTYSAPKDDGFTTRFFQLFRKQSKKMSF